MKYHIETLGCKVNIYESNVMAEILENNGYTYSNNNPGVIIINTCTVTNTANSKSLKTLRRLRRNNQNSIILLCGCLPENNDNNKELLKYADIIIGNVGKTNIINLINEYKNNNIKIIDTGKVMKASFEEMQLTDYSRTRANVKIQDGCENYCSYCIIPYTRGKVRSKDPRIVIEEVKSLVNNGHKEIVLSGIHTGHYGADLEGFTFYDLLSKLVSISGLKTLRISSIELNEITDEIIDLFSKHDVLADHLHIPLQSGEDSILKAMNRKYDIDDFKERVNKIRTVRPNINLTTDVIVGFPGESDKSFQETIKNIKEINFSKVHVFPYSERKGTKSALMNNKLDPKTIKERVTELLEVSKELELNYMNSFINKEVYVIKEKDINNYSQGHSSNYLNVLIPKTDKEEYNVIIKEINYPYVIGVIK